MIQLNEKDYEIALSPLLELPINTLFARAVLRGIMPGQVYVDDVNNPFAFLIAHGYGMSLLFGDASKVPAEWLEDYMLNKAGVRDKNEWLQVYPDGWNDEVEKALGPDLVKKGTAVQPADTASKVMEFVRANFAFDREKFEATFGVFNPEEHTVIRTTKEIYQGLSGGVSPEYFWKDADHFLTEGAGFTVLADGEAASTAFSAFVMDGQLEIGIQTEEKFRGRGYALHACAALIQYCLERGLEPVWACRHENTASYNLAHKLGFTPSRLIPYYCLPV